jgi:diacylglycerol O-acyltransferase / wax synthase
MSRLGLLDQAMFKLEEGGLAPVHMCGAMILEASDSPYPVDGTVVADHLAACMEEVSLMRQRLVQDPLKMGDLRLVEDPHFDVRNHVSCSTLDEPGGYEELTEALGEFSARRLDLTGPLWRCEVFEGLAGGQIALAIKIHHAIQDGTGAQRILGRIWSPEPLPGRKPQSKARQADTVPTPLSLLGGALVENAQRLYIKAPSFLFNNIRPIVRNLSKVISNNMLAGPAQGQAIGPKPVKAHKTSLNVAPISTRRAVSYLELPLKELRSLCRHFGCSINDLALLLNSYALEHYFADIGEVIDFDLVAGMPIDLRSEADVSAGNMLALTRVNLHNTVGDIRERLQAIVEQTAAIKATTKPGTGSGEAEPGIDYEALGDLFSPLTLDIMIYSIGRFRLMDKATFINVAIANVPGSRVPVYLAGAKMHSQIPMGPCADSLALNVTIGSTEELLVMGYHGCGETVQDKELFVQGAREAFQALKRVSRRGSRAGARQRRKPTANKASPKTKRAPSIRSP